MINTYMKTMDDKLDFWKVPEQVKNIYMSEGVIATLLDYERVLDEMDIYAFRNWSIGELVEGPDIKRYSVSCVFMWPRELMPDPKGARRLLPFGCEVKFKKTQMSVPIKIEDPDDYVPGTRKPILSYLPEDYEFKDDITVFASGKDGIFSAGTPIGKTKYTGEVELFVDPNQLSFVTVNLIKPSKEVF